MRIVRYEKDGQAHYGIWEDDRIRQMSGSPFGDWQPGPQGHRVSEVRLLAPVVPTKILCVGLNFRGYTCFNDVTERPLSVAHGQLTRSKGFDTFAPFGPCIATGLDPSRLLLRTFLNGTLMQEAKLSEMIFSVPYLVHYLSQCMTLLPGDLISAGTPRGVAPMKPGDVVEVAIDGIGVLRNPVRAAGGL